MKFRKATIGVRHKDCWGSLCTVKFPDIVMKEKGPINVEKVKAGVRLNATWDVSFNNLEEFEDFLKHIKSYQMVESVKVIDKYEDSALIRTIWTNKQSSYEIVLKNNCLYTSPVIQKEGYEVYDVITEDPKKLVKVLGELEYIGEAKLFSVERVDSEENPFKLTNKQSKAIQLAVSHDFYEWPRKVSLDEVGAMVGMKRRTFQENLRKAEAKIIPYLIKSFFAKQEC